MVFAVESQNKGVRPFNKGHKLSSILMLAINLSEGQSIEENGETLEHLGIKHSKIKEIVTLFSLKTKGAKAC